MPLTLSLLSRFRTLARLALLVSVCGVALSSRAQDVLTYHNNSRTGLNNKETILTTSNVNQATFGKLFTLPTDGLVDAEPLLSVGGIRGRSNPQSGNCGK